MDKSHQNSTNVMQKFNKNSNVKQMFWKHPSKKWKMTERMKNEKRKFKNPSMILKP